MEHSPVIVAPSILAANFQSLQAELDSIASADWIQVDVMDGHFVPNLSFGAPVIKWLQTDLPLDIHLMVQNPADRIAEFLALDVAHITFHGEVVSGFDTRKDLIDTIHTGGATAGIAINPDTPLESVADILPHIDLLLVMSVFPGFGGQAFMPEVLEKVRAARAEYPNLMIQMDGGVDATTAAECRAAGANNLVAGSAIFGQEDRAKAISNIRGS